MKGKVCLLHSLLGIILTLFLFSISTNAQQRIQGYVEQGGFSYSGTTTAKVQRSYPGATVTVYNTGTLTLANIYSNSALTTPKANPFVADANAYYFFYTGGGAFDLVFSGAGITSSFSQIAVSTTNTTDAGDTVKGITKLSVAPITANNPIARGTNDPLVIDAKEYASLSAAITAIGATNTTLNISTTLTVSTNITIPATITLRFVGAGNISVNNLSSLTINGGILAENRRVFSGAGSVVLPINNYSYEINPVWFSAGSGTLADPWTEWDTRIVWRQRTTYRFPSGFYSYAVSPQFAQTGIRLYGSAGTYLIYTGNARAMDLQAPAEFVSARDIIVDNFIVQGVNATQGLWVEAVLHSLLRNIRVRNMPGTSFYIRSSHLNTFENLTTHDPIGDSLIGSGYPAVTIVPANGFHFDDGGFFLTNNAITVINPNISYASNIGVAIHSLVSSVFVGGAVELCGQEGFTFEGNSAQTNNISIIGTEIEHNGSTGSDVSIGGVNGITFRDVFSFNGSYNIFSGAQNIIFDGGTYNSIIIWAGAKRTSLKNIFYNYTGTGILSDAGYQTTYDNVVNSAGGLITHDVTHRNVTPQVVKAGITLQPIVLHRGILVFGAAGVALSNDPITATSKWRLIFRGTFIDTLNGDAAPQNAPYIEVSSEYPTINFQNNVSLTFNQEGGGNGRILGVVSGAANVIFTGEIAQIPNSHTSTGSDSIDVKGGIKTLDIKLAEGLIKSIVLDWNTTTKLPIYAAPTGKSVIITKVAVRNPSISLTTATCGFGFNANADDVITPETWTELTSSSAVTIRMAKDGASRGLAAEAFGMKCTVAQGVAATATIDVFGYLY